MPRLATGKKVEMIIPCEVRDTGRDKYQQHDITSRCNLKMDNMELLAQRQSLTDLETSNHQAIKMWGMEK